MHLQNNVFVILNIASFVNQIVVNVKFVTQHMNWINFLQNVKRKNVKLITANNAQLLILLYVINVIIAIY